jgi:hypothetical protein
MKNPERHQEIHRRNPDDSNLMDNEIADSLTDGVKGVKARGGEEDLSNDFESGDNKNS